MDQKLSKSPQDIVSEIHTECTKMVTLTPQSAQRFFKTSVGTYGAHDAFLGITVPYIRKIAKKYSHVSLEVIEHILTSRFNEERLLALLLLVHHYQKGDSETRECVYQCYLNNLQQVSDRTTA